MVLVVVGVRPDTELAADGRRAPRRQGRDRRRPADAHRPAARVRRRGLRRSPTTGCSASTYLPLGTTAHKQGRVAGENALGGNRPFAGSLGTQVVKIFDLAAARTGLRDHEAVAAGHQPGHRRQPAADDHKAYYPGSHPDPHPRHRRPRHRAAARRAAVRPHGAEIAKRVDIYATAIFHGMTVDAVSDLDLSYTPPLGSPWDAVQMATQAWVRQHSAAESGRAPVVQTEPVPARP